MPPQVSWCPLPFDERRSLVYSPAWGRSYLLSAAQHDDPALRRWLGLGGAHRVVTLPDPAGSVLRTRSPDTPDGSPGPPRLGSALYGFVHRTRSVIPFGAMARWVARRPAAPGGRLASDPGQISADVERVERAVGLSDCYPRALFTAYLCARAGLPFQLVIGALVPTRMLHAWCCVDGRIPYEPTPQHWIYQPALLLDCTP